jgi:acetylglutamate kinase
MAKEKLHIVKIGGNIIDDSRALQLFLSDLASVKENCLLVHGGGKMATALAKQLGIEAQLVNGRRITDSEMLKVVVMVYAGLINKQIVAHLQSGGCNAIGLCGADANIIPAVKRAAGAVDYGFAGDISPETIPATTISRLIGDGYTPVIAPITHDGEGQLLNTNADTIASSLAIALSGIFDVYLHFCFEKKGVLKDSDDDDSVIDRIDEQKYAELKRDGTISGGMLPKMDNAFHAISSGVQEVTIGHASSLTGIITQQPHAGTRIIK